MNRHSGSAFNLHTRVWLSFYSLLVVIGWVFLFAGTTQAQSWGATGSLSTARSLHTAPPLANGKVLALGGINVINPCCTNTGNAELYDPAAGQWNAMGGMTTPRVIHTLTLLSNGKVLAAGGSAANLLKSSELYDPATGNWTATAELSAARQNHTATLLSNGKVLAIAGSGAGQLTSAELFDSGEPVVTTLSAASYQLQIAAKEIVAAFGQNFSTSTAVATVKIRDGSSIERLAPRFFASPQQINYQIPEGTAAGQATVTVTASDGRSIAGVIQVITAAPAIFTINASSTGAAAAVDAFTGGAAPFNATRANGDPNIIAAFGTGVGADAADVDGNANASVQARIDGNAATVLYAGRAPGFVGLNQLNLVLPAGIVSGARTLVVSRNGVAGNPIAISIK